MPPQIIGVGSLEIDVCDLERASEFYTKVWNLEDAGTSGGARRFNGAGARRRILALRRAANAAAVRRVTFDAADTAAVDALHARVRASGAPSEAPRGLEGGAYGFGFADPEGRNLAVVHDAAAPARADSARDRPLKIAHINFNCADIVSSKRFFCDTLGFRVIDEAGPQTFLHCDNSDHSSMVLCKGAKPTLNHAAFEMPDLDSVMRGAGRMKEAGYPIQWGPGRHGAGNNVFAYFAGWEEFPLEYTSEVLQIDETYVPRGPAEWKFAPGRSDQWGITEPHSPRWRRIQDLYGFVEGGWRL